MNVISRNAIREAIAGHPEGANWLVFDAPQGRRLIVRVVYADQHANGTIFVKNYLTHADYDKNRWKGACY